MILHVVKPGDSIYTIAKRYAVPPADIIRDNRLADPNRLVVGQTLVIMKDVTEHTVLPGESMYSIARKYGVTLEELRNANPQITNPAAIMPGQVVLIPVPPQKLGTIAVNGYALPNISMDALKDTLPFLTYLSIFSHEVRPDGSLSSVSDEPLIRASRQAGVAPIMVITNLEEEGGFSGELAHTILTNDAVQETLINNVIDELKDKNYAGLNIDFEYIPRGDRENYNRFIEKAAPRLRALGYILLSALAPKISADQPGLLYEAHDYPVHGRIMDYVILMTYEWGYLYGEPMAVAPLNEVQRVLDYAVTAIPSEKILMGMPNYGYDWTLPYARGTAAHTLSNTGAVTLAAKENAAIQFDATAQAPFFYYYDEERRRHVVWFDDARSTRARLSLVSQYNLGGVSYWTINRYFPQNWLVLSSMYNIKKVL
ncbi:LysM peptidoglycan-binding domain-containing protein [Papillibacter cinnamivorans]|uniref:Spore germination protein n=1 Tax=Papillibacter cinnamivorans DSM 12816 TaxID=1122930 RepID=A0A1W2AI11_9FIRM|nr:LysM peptidoglycan-binding domain-containing protein [Papillibacter cinnamivorans]SMC59898.1 spore germination protein [Papillibacter cinnamivorans DSM 12816]